MADRLANELRQSKDKTTGRVEGNNWGTYDSPIEDYDKWFKIAFGGKSIFEIVEAKEGPVVIDLMASSAALATLFEKLPDPNKLGIAVSLADDRDPLKRGRDEKLGIKALIGDLNDTRTWRKINTELGGRKADLILERGGVGVHYLPVNEKFYGMVLNRLWGVLSDSNGTMFIQGPTAHTLRQSEVRAKEWIDLLRSNGIDVSFSDGNDELGFNSVYLKLVKTHDSPAKITHVSLVIHDLLKLLPCHFLEDTHFVNQTFAYRVKVLT